MTNIFKIGQHLMHTSNINLLFSITMIDDMNKVYGGVMKNGTGFDHEELTTTIPFDAVHKYYDISPHIYKVGDTFSTKFFGERALGVIKELLPHGLYLVHRTSYLGDSPKDMGAMRMDDVFIQSIYEQNTNTKPEVVLCPEGGGEECTPIDVGFHFSKYACKYCNKELKS